MLSIPLHLPTLLFVAVACFVGPSAQAAAPSKSPGSARTIAVELVETGSKGGPQRVAFVVPIGGEIQAWVRGGEDPRFCRVRVDSVGEGELGFGLECARSSQSRSDLHLQATRALTPGKAVVLGKVARADGRSVEVRAEL